MKVKITMNYAGPSVPLTSELMRALNVKLGDTLDIDIPMTGGGLTVHKATQRTGEEVV